MSTLSTQYKLASIFGKSTVPRNHPAYVWTRQITTELLRKNFRVIHGGYAGGIMEAVDEAAQFYISEHNLSRDSNTCVPQQQFDTVGWQRVHHAVPTPVAKDVYDRLRMITTSSDIAIVAPLGGDGTFLEIMTLFHKNMIAKYTGEKIVPIIFLQMTTGTDWKAIMETVVEQLDVSLHSVSEIPWIYFVADQDKFVGILKSL